MGPEELQERLIDMAVAVGAITNALPRTKFGRQIGNQLVRCGTSPMANYAEACGSESKKDFIHKLGICLKELRETRVWLRMVLKSQQVTDSKVGVLYDEVDQLRRIIGKSITTARSRR
ncbi:MAG: four helix bundle protein [Gemmatimonadetes bacterium]|nr:four helix bundle protein [Gemmatimonadota bacterium]|tara:strand:- start:2111 stop:2464 length:354 start_codon:yes stop_codon:yes gene_type:complete